MNNNIDHTDPAKNMNTERGNGGETHQRAGYR
jgi:catalase